MAASNTNASVSHDSWPAISSATAMDITQTQKLRALIRVAYVP